MLSLQAEKPEILSSLRKLQISDLEKAERILEMVGIETVAYLRSLTNEIRPPAKPGGNTRRAHPGHWADVTGQLALSYAWEVVRVSDVEVRLVLSNSAEHAIWLELREGFFVLTGVTESDGPVEQALRRIIPQIAPGWTLA